ncbi:MAG TPA: PilZ domain-containing protein [Holophaga sp.]|nr:PilZ domain-containing protein [Holophaga sp.]
MAKPKSGKPEDNEGRIEDPAILRGVFQELLDTAVEFPIKVEGTHTLPYFSTVKDLAWEQGHMVLKLVRPLPHELMVGAVFHFLCASGEQRFEGFITYGGREGYLQYTFLVPRSMTLADRRAHKRYPFRPRESAYVILQDSSIPGLGVAGPLVNICMGGLALRVDRILRLDTGIRIPPSTAIFDRGKGFPRVRIQELPKLHLLEVRGITAHAFERGTEVILGLSFTGLQEEEEAALRASLDIRDRMQRGAFSSSRPDSGPIVLRSESRGGAAPEPSAPAEADAPVHAEALLRRLRRRSALVGVVKAPGPERDALEARLREAGFHRLLLADTVEDLAAAAQAEPRRRAPRLVLADLSVAHAGDAEPLEAVRAIESAVAGGVPTVILCDEVDPTLLLSQAAQTRYLYTDFPPESLETLDGLLEGPEN